jgi:hypothetical protein
MHRRFAFVVLSVDVWSGALGTAQALQMDCCSISSTGEHSHSWLAAAAGWRDY